MKKYLPLIIYLLLLLSSPVSAFTDDEERWLNSENDTDHSQVNEGILEFINHSLKPSVLHTVNRLKISPSSIDNGWVYMEQCYRHIDKLPELDIIFQYRHINNLSVLSKQNIESVRINKQRITLTNVGHNSELCVSANVRIFYQNLDLSFSLINGPYHRRFLDGYYPFRVSLSVAYPETLLLVKKIIPEKQLGFSVNHAAGTIAIDTLFKGILKTEIIFELLK
ncbi:MAG: hypothetical protein OEY36_13010 [Gammaproteobacteria bacterium]|nr:hypothetical protein [Gammaproteobacteria bacterium]